jgi:F0F1-type ATP synthase membrane subunit a
MILTFVCFANSSSPPILLSAAARAAQAASALFVSLSLTLRLTLSLSLCVCVYLNNEQRDEFLLKSRKKVISSGVMKQKTRAR